MQLRPRQRSYVAPSGEPSLAEIMADPIVHLVMRSDGVTPQDVLAVIANARCAGQGAPALDLR